jgi:hypothetical protein
MKNNIPTIGWSDFARRNSTPYQGNSHTLLPDAELVDLVEECWHLRQPGTGEVGLERKVLVPVPAVLHAPKFGLPAGAPLFRCGTALLRTDIPVKAQVVRRAGQDQEDPFIENYISVGDASRLGIMPETANFVKIVLYSAEALLENGGKRSGPWQWEIVTILASPVETEPMTPLTMARNLLGLPGGTKPEVPYPSEEFARAVVYWSRRTKIVGVQ